jgi:hypothetical protein
MTKLELELGESQIRMGGHRAQSGAIRGNQEHSADLLLDWLEIDPQSDAIRRNQAQSDAIRRNHTCSLTGLRSTHVPSEAPS